MSTADRHEFLKGTRRLDSNRIAMATAQQIVTEGGGLLMWDEIKWEEIDPEWCRRQIPELRAALAAMDRFAKMVEQRATGATPAICAQCGSQFYPARADARYCGGACRMRAHRARGRARARGRDPVSPPCQPDGGRE